MKTAIDHEKAGLRKQNAGTVHTVSQNITDRSDSTVQTAVNYGMASYVAAARPVASFLEDGTADRKSGDTIVSRSFMSSLSLSSSLLTPLTLTFNSFTKACVSSPPALHEGRVQSAIFS